MGFSSCRRRASGRVHPSRVLCAASKRPTASFAQRAEGERRPSEGNGDRRGGDPMTSKTLSEHASKALLAQYGVPVANERFVHTAAEARAAAAEIGFPAV